MLSYHETYRRTDEHGVGVLARRLPLAERRPL